MSGREKEAQELVKKADEKMNAGFFGSLFSSKSSRFEEALDYLEKAAHIYKLNQKWAEAGSVFEKCGNIENELSSDAAKYYLESAHCYSFVDSTKSLMNKKKALDYYVSHGRYQLAGKTMKEIAEKQEEEKSYENAGLSYKKAAEYYSMESMNSKSYEQGCLIKYADIVCSTFNEESKMDDKLFNEVFSIYDKIGFSYLNVPLLKSGAKDYFFKAMCVHLAFGSNINEAQKKLNSYLNEDPTMIDTREDIFLKKALDAVKTKDATQYSEAELVYKKYTDLDKWKTVVFKRILQAATGANDYDADDFT